MTRGRGRSCLQVLLWSGDDVGSNVPLGLRTAVQGAVQTGAVALSIPLLFLDARLGEFRSVGYCLC